MKAQKLILQKQPSTEQHKQLEQTKQYLRAGPSKIAGTGCFALRNFKKGETVGYYTGELIDEKEADKRYLEREMTYLFDIGGGKYIDGDTDDNPVKYINHSCQGNCESDQKGKKVWIYALRNIKEGEELTYDYNLEVDPQDEEKYKCFCGANACRGTMKGKR